MAGIGKLFKFGGGKKPPETPRKDYDGRQPSGEGGSDEEGYVDPTTFHSMLPPSSGSLSSKMPNYPPPRPNHSTNPAFHSLERSHRGPSEDASKPPVKPRTVRPTRNTEGQPVTQPKVSECTCVSCTWLSDCHLYEGVLIVSSCSYLCFSLYRCFNGK